jgi:hypothetical protein
VQFCGRMIPTFREILLSPPSARCHNPEDLEFNLRGGGGGGGGGGGRGGGGRGGGGGGARRPRARGDRGA